MSLVRSVRLADVAAQPWRNGGGLTRELLAWPAGGAWRVRVSVADIAADGPFSAFPGVERWFAVLEGEGVVLSLPRGERSVGRGDEPLRFDGEEAVHCRLIEGPTRDLNLMVVRGAGSASMRRAAPGSTLEDPTLWRALYSAGVGRLEVDGVVTPLHPGQLLWSDALDAAQWRLLDGAAAWWMSVGS
jgi:hypothetical protein